MSVRVRFAPSPTGYLHIGGARTAMYCYLIAKAKGGKYVLRIEDTDLERSRREYEEAIVDDLKWMGIEHDEGPDVGGEFGPYRQSERGDVYKRIANQLVEEGKAYPCFLTSDELDVLTEQAKSEEKAPHAYHGKYRDLSPEEAQKRVDAGEEHVIRFKNNQKRYTFTDLVRGDVSFGPDMVGDFVIMRSNGMPVYNFCCVIDDWLMEMTHVIRAEEHLPNTLRQLMLYEALGATPPEFCHCSLLVGEDRQKLSKRHGATSVVQYKEQNYLPAALANYLCLLGWSHPDETDIFDLEDIVKIFDLNRFNKSPALYDINKLNFFNGEHMRRLGTDELINYLAPSLSEGNPFHKQSHEWKGKCVEFFKSKFDIPGQFEPHLSVLFESNPSDTDEYQDVLSWETTTTIREYVKSEIERLAGEGKAFVDASDYDNWVDHIKKELKIKGKPLFKGIRAALTLAAEGPDLKDIIPLTPMSVLKSRF